MRELMEANTNDIYLQDEERAYRVARYIRALGESVDEATRIRVFREMFPDDPFVRDYEKTHTNEALVLLAYHVEAVYSQVSIATYFDKNGLTDDYLVQNLFKLTQSKDQSVAYRATISAIRLKKPEEMVFRAKPRVPTRVVTKEEKTFTLNINDEKSAEKSAVIEGLLEKINSANTVVRPDDTIHVETEESTGSEDDRGTDGARQRTGKKEDLY